MHQNQKSLRSISILALVLSVFFPDSGFSESHSIGLDEELPDVTHNTAKLASCQAELNSAYREIDSLDDQVDTLEKSAGERCTDQDNIENLARFLKYHGHMAMAVGDTILFPPSVRDFEGYGVSVFSEISILVEKYAEQKHTISQQKLEIGSLTAKERGARKRENETHQLYLQSERSVERLERDLRSANLEISNLNSIIANLRRQNSGNHRGGSQPTPPNPNLNSCAIITGRVVSGCPYGESQATIVQNQRTDRPVEVTIRKKPKFGFGNSWDQTLSLQPGGFYSFGCGLDYRPEVVGCQMK